MAETYESRLALTQRTGRVMRWFRWDRDGDVIRDIARAVVALDIEACIGHGYRDRRPRALPKAQVAEALRWLRLAKELGLIEPTATAGRLRDTTGDSAAILTRIEEAQR